MIKELGIGHMKNVIGNIADKTRSKLSRVKTPKQKLFRIFLRLLSLQLLSAGILQWARTVQLVDWRGKYFTEMPLDWQIATVYYAILDLVAGVGVWMNAPWGAVIWIFRTLSQFFMHTVLAESFGSRPYMLTFYLLTVILFFILRHHAESEKKFTLRRGLGLVQQMPERRQIWRK